ncbi:MAG: hypothetical protein AAFY64_07085, partial [Pseudomonadota bacterium]
MSARDVASSGSVDADTQPQSKQKPLKIFIVTGEHSGDALGGSLIPALRGRLDRDIVFEGLGGREMATQGLQSILPLDDVMVMGPVA